MPDKPSVPAMTGMICRYMLTMGGVVMLTVAAYFGLQGMISSHELAVMAKNQVERQMVLSQRSALLTQQLIHVDDPDARTDLRRQLAVAAGQLETAHTQLVRDLFGHKGITEPDYDVIAKMYFQDPSRLEDQVNGFVRDIRTLIATSDDQLSEDDPSAARVLLAARGRLLDGLNTVVYQIELDHRKKTKAFELQDSYVLAAIILVIVLEGIFIFIPLIMRIRREFDRLGKIQEELDTAQQQEKIANRAKTEFLANISHELRTPLNSIIGFSDILASERFGPIGSSQYLDYARDINRSGIHLLDLITDVLDVSRIETGNIGLHNEWLDVQRIVISASRMVRERSIQSNLKFDLQVSRNLPRLYADKQRLKQILVNLLTNAIKFSVSGGTITCKVYLDEHQRFTFDIIDQGIGIAPEHLESILRPFEQADGSLARKFEGAGLGLPLSKNLTELHGGTLKIESKLGRGTKVTVRFPHERTDLFFDLADIPPFLKKHDDTFQHAASRNRH